MPVTGPGATALLPGAMSWAARRPGGNQSGTLPFGPFFTLNTSPLLAGEGRC